MTVTDLADVVVRLRKAGCVFAEDEAAVLGEAAADPAHLSELVDRRAQGEPLEQVVGFADFCGVRVRLRPGVFVPRVRSELLVHTALAELEPPTEAELEPQTETELEPRTEAELEPRTETELEPRTETELERQAEAEQAPRAPGQPAKKPETIVVDLCCGSGALGLAVRRKAPAIHLLATDSDPVAVACARDNLGADVYQGDLFQALPHTLRGRIDVLLANVPYVATGHIPLLPAEARLHEPHSALDGGPDGLDVFRAVVAGAAGWLAPGGLLLSEITEVQTAAAVAVVEAAGLVATVVEDEDLEAHVVTGRRPELPGVTGLR